MRINLLRHVAIALGMTACGVAHAQTGPYQPPAYQPSGYQAPGYQVPGYAPPNQQTQTTQTYSQQTPAPPNYGAGNQPGYQPGYPVQGGAQPQYQAAPQYQYQAPPTGQPQYQAPGGGQPTHQATSGGQAAYQAPAGGQAAYEAPAQWNQFNPQAGTATQPSQNVFRPASTGGPVMESYGAPAMQPAMSAPVVTQNAPVMHQPVPQGHSVMHSSPAGDCSTCNSTPSYNSAFSEAVNAPWPSGNQVCGQEAVFAPQASSIGPICPWFGGGNVLFYSIRNNSNRVLASSNGMPVLYESSVEPADGIGFDVHAGRYLGCGQYGLDFRYMNFNPGEEMAIATGTATQMRVAMPQWQSVYVGVAGNPDVYSHIDTNAVAFRARRDVGIQGLEANLVGFGLGGARRMGHCGPRLGSRLAALGLGAGGYGSACGPNACGDPCGGYNACAPQCPPAKPKTGFFGGAGGPLARACSGRIQVQTLHGFRWFQFEDAYEFAANTDGVAGYGADDIYYNADVENNLYGYQFGSVISYCVGHRFLLTAGSKFGIYGNDVNVRQRLGTQTLVAYTGASGASTGDYMTDESETVLAGLGELDLGVGYRVNCRWTIRGGYRLLGVAGVATAIDAAARGGELNSVAKAGDVHANDSLILHGAYVGADFNW